jgi:hypothetical protein
VLLATLPASGKDPETVGLAFGWTPGLRASVTYVKTRTTVADERSSRSGTSKYTLLADVDGDNLRIRFENPTFELGGAQKLPASVQAQLVGQVANLMPDYLVTQKGEFVGLHDLPDFQRRLRALMVDILPKDADPKLIGQVQSFVTSEAFVTSTAAEQWNAVVGAWLGAELEVGEQYTYSEKQPVPVFPGQQVLMHYTFSATRLSPCRRGGTKRTCAELEMRSTADAEDTKAIIQSVVSSLAGKQLPQTPVFKTLEVENVVQLVTEPDGLVPHACTVTRTVKGTISVDGRDQHVEQVDETTVTYTYPASP